MDPALHYHSVAFDAAELDAWLTDARSRIPYTNQLCQLNQNREIPRLCRGTERV
jgi:hypothetical protein